MADDHKPEKAMAGMLNRRNVWPAPSGEACPDASTLAAYFERSLTATESAQWELHFSTCLRCQEQLAALVRSEPAAAAKPAADRKPAFAWAWNWRWMAPVGAAAAVLIFVLSYKTLYAPLQQPKSADLAMQRASEKLSPSPAVAQKPAEATAEKSETASAAKPKNAAPVEKAKAKVAVDELKSKKDLADKEAGRSVQAFRTPNMTVGGVSGGVAGAVASQPMPAPAREEKAALAAQNQVVIAQAEVPKAQARDNALDRAQVPQANAAREKVNQQAEQVTVEAGAQAAKPPSAIKQEALHKKAAADQVSQAGKLVAAPPAPSPQMAMRAGPSELVLGTPKSGVLWRFKDANKIERTQDGGKTWSLQKNPTQENILAAAAPSESVCWAGGSNGVLLRTTDGGENWEKMPSPTKYAIVSLKASDHLVVTMTSADGHSYESRDAGLHWRPL